LAPYFDLTRFGRAQPRFDVSDLFKLNPRVLHVMPLTQVNDRLAKEGKTPVSEEFWHAVAPNLTTFKDIEKWRKIVESDDIFPVAETDRAFCGQAASLLPDETVTTDTFAAWTAVLKEKTGRKGRDLFHPLRLALTGCEDGPELKALLPLLGREKVLKRLKG